MRVVAGLALLGAGAGALAKAADESGNSWAADLGSYPAAWVLAVALIGRAAPSWPAAAVRAAAFFGAMTVAYYAYAAWVLGLGWNPLLSVWLILSATAVAAASVAAWWGTGRPGWLPGALMASAAGTVLAGGTLQRTYLWWNGELLEVVARPVQSTVDLVVAAALVFLLPRHRSTKVWAVVLVVPMTWFAARGLDLLSAVAS